MNRFILVVLGVLASLPVRAQSNLNLQPRAEETLRQYETRMEAYFAPKIARVGVAALLEEEGSDYNQYRNFLHTWQMRLGSNGDFRLRFRQDAMQFGAAPRRRTARNDAVAAGIGVVPNDVAWQELGPTVMPGGGNPAAGIGPIEFITFYEPALGRMLAGSTMGGLFYSRNAGLTWQQAGTDTKIGRSGVMSAVFHPGSFQTWFAASSGNPDNNLPLWIGPAGGIFRTVDEGAVWTKIASDAQLGGVWTQVYKLVIDPSNGSKLWAATSRGLYFTSNAMAPAPVWNVVAFNGELVNDFELRPGNSGWQYAAVATPLVGGGYTNWRLMYTSDGGMTWQLVPNQSPSTATASGITIEVSPANAANLYTAIMQPAFTTTLAVHDLGSGARNDVTTGAYVSHGSGHGFGVDPFDPDEIFLNDYTRGRRYDASSGASVPFPAGTNTFHADIEDIVPHPVNPNEVWAAHHGGIAMSPDNGANWFDRSTGLGVAVTLRMADAVTDSRYLLLGLYHDGSILTDSPWHDFWSPSWRIVGCCDGLTPLIDPLDSQNMWITDQVGRWYRSTNTGQTFSIRGPLSAGWEVDAAFDMLNPSTQYRLVDNAGIREIHRSFDNGNTWKRISRFDLLWPPGTSQYILWRVYTPENASGTLVVHLLERPNSNVDWHHHLYRTKFANDPVPANVIAAWEELPLPGDQWISDVEFDRTDPNILYIANGSPTNMGHHPFGTMMVVKVDYTDPTRHTVPYTCTPGLCEDLSQNLPNASTGGDSLALDRDGSGMYYVCDYGAYYSSAESRAAGDGWSKLGSELPNTLYEGIALNYVSRKVRVGSKGRGAWEHDMPGTIRGMKFDDVNGNGVRDNGEPGLPNWTISLHDGSAVVATATTNAAGVYVFTMVPAGDYVIYEMQQSGWTRTYPSGGSYPVHVDAGDSVANIDFGNRLSTPAACIAPPANMVAWWTFDSLTGGVAGERAGASNKGTISGGATSTTHVSSAIHLDGTSQFITVPSHPELNLGTGDLTIDAWVRTTGTGLQPIVDKRGGTIFGYTLFLFNGRLGFQMADRALQQNCSSNNATTGCTNFIAPAGSALVSDGAWHHVAVTVDRDRTDGGNLWVDGAIVLTFDPTIRNQTLDTRAPLLIGKRSAVSPAVYFSGDLDEVEIFKRALGPGEIQAMVKAGSNGKCKCSEPDSCNFD